MKQRKTQKEPKEKELKGKWKPETRKGEFKNKKNETKN